MGKHHNRGLRIAFFALVAVILVLVLLVAVGCFLLLTRYTWAAGSLREKDSPYLELRGEELSVEEYRQLREKLPETEIRWNVPIQDKRISWDSTEITLSDLIGEDWQTLALFPNLTRVNIEGQVHNERLEECIAQYPQISFLWSLPVGNTTVQNTAESLDLTGQPVIYEELDRVLHWLPELRELNLLGCPLTDDQVLQLAKDYPSCHILWDLNINGEIYRTDLEELDFSGRHLESTEQVEKLLPCFFNVKRVILSDCGLDDETLDALNRKYDEIRFIWTVYIKGVPIRTDATWFYPFKYQRDMVVEEKDVYPLRYCSDMVCIDIGHMFGVKTCDWAAFMPNLEYLILGETGVTDLTPLSGLKKLKYLELFTIDVTDFTPLLGCTGLEDLNLGMTYGDPDVIAQMSWLKNLWWCDANGYGNSDRRKAVERMCQTLTDTKIAIYIDHPTAGGWRKLPNYFAMRDYLGMFYLS